MSLVNSLVEERYRRTSKYEISLDSGVPTGFSTHIYAQQVKQPSNPCPAWFSLVATSRLKRCSHFELAVNSRLSRMSSVEAWWRQTSDLCTGSYRKIFRAPGSLLRPTSKILPLLSTHNIENLKEQAGGLMARTNIEEEAWARIYRLAELQGCSVREAAGTASCLWHQSQSLIKAFGSTEEILEWASLHNVSDQDAKKWILSLEKARLISRKEDATFLINGNEIQIENMVSKTTRATKGGQALKKKLAELKRLKAGLKPATRGVQEAPRGSNQIKSSQVNATQNNATHAEPPPLVKIWNENRGDLPSVEKLNAVRSKQAAKRWLSLTETEWVALVKKVAASDFCNGRTKSSDWVATFDWFVGEKKKVPNYVKVLEGNYDNREPKKDKSTEWQETAQKVLSALKIPAGDERVAYLGEDLLKRVRAIGGMTTVGQMPSNDFTIQKLANLLKNAEVSQ